MRGRTQMIPEYKPECTSFWASLSISHFITIQIRGLPHYVSWGRGQGLQKETQFNSGCLEIVKICIVFSFLFFFPFSRKHRGRRLQGTVVQGMRSGARLQIITVIPSLAALLLPFLSYSLNLTQQPEEHCFKIQVRPYYFSAQNTPMAPQLTSEQKLKSLTRFLENKTQPTKPRELPSHTAI